MPAFKTIPCARNRPTATRRKASQAGHDSIAGPYLRALRDFVGERPVPAAASRSNVSVLSTMNVWSWPDPVDVTRGSGRLSSCAKLKGKC
jgi:hypothetical protein